MIGLKASEITNQKDICKLSLLASIGNKKYLWLLSLTLRDDFLAPNS